MRNRTVLVTGGLERNFGFSEILLDRGFETYVAEESGKGLVEEIDRVKPAAVLMPAFLSMQDAVSVIANVKKLCADCRNTFFFIMGSGEGLKTINYIVNNGADYYFHITTKLSDVGDKILSFFEEDQEGTDLFAKPKEVSCDCGMMIHELLRESGVLPHLKGFLYLNDAVLMGINCHQWPIPLTREVYPALAERFDTTQLRVERAMRNAILVAWANYIAEKNTNNPIFSKCIQRPSNREFLGLMNYELKKRIAKNAEEQSQSVG